MFEKYDMLFNTSGVIFVSKEIEEMKIIKVIWQKN